MVLSMRRVVLLMPKPMTGGGRVHCEGKDADGNPFSMSDRP